MRKEALITLLAEIETDMQMADSYRAEANQKILRLKEALGDVSTLPGDRKPEANELDANDRLFLIKKNQRHACAQKY